jgi:hypothetical protein
MEAGSRSGMHRIGTYISSGTSAQFLLYVFVGYTASHIYMFGLLERFTRCLDEFALRIWMRRIELPTVKNRTPQ